MALVYGMQWGFRNTPTPITPSVPKIASLIQGFDARPANRPLLVFDFRALCRSTLSASVPESQKTKNGRLVGLASNPSVIAPILEL